MRYPRWLALVLAVATLAAAAPASAGAPRRLSQPLGTGAQFLPATAAFYLAADADPSQVQLQYLDRLSALYLSAPEVDEAKKQLGGLAGGMTGRFETDAARRVGCLTAPSADYPRRKCRPCRARPRC
jgi:hypothetical protein